jgi:DNA-binding MarR family transcriptional regulator
LSFVCERHLLPHVDLDGTRITDRAERLGISKQAVSQLVGDLEAMGVMARLPDPEDARARRVVFTRLGRQALLDGLGLLRTLERELTPAIGDQTMAQLRLALTAILAQLEGTTAAE